MSLAELPADIRAAIEKCKAFQVERDADKPNSPEPAAFVIVTCDETMVMMPPSIPDGDRLARMLTGEKKDLLRYYETHFNCTIYWMKGQAGEGVPAAVEAAGVTPGRILLEAKCPELRDPCLPTHDVVGISGICRQSAKAAVLTLAGSLRRCAARGWERRFTELRQGSRIDL